MLGPYVPLSLVVHFMSRDSMCRYLKFGCVSVRKMFRELQRLLACSPKHTLPPVSLVGQLYWRAYFYLASVTTANYDKMAGNSICRQIAWARDAQVIKAWEAGRAGYPWSVMRCLRHFPFDPFSFSCVLPPHLLSGLTVSPAGLMPS